MNRKSLVLIKQIAYVSWQTNDRLHHTRLGPTDLWIVDVATTLVTRATLPVCSLGRSQDVFTIQSADTRRCSSVVIRSGSSLCGKLTGSPIVTVI